MLVRRNGRKSEARGNYAIITCMGLGGQTAERQRMEYLVEERQITWIGKGREGKGRVVRKEIGMRIVVEEEWIEKLKGLKDMKREEKE